MTQKHMSQLELKQPVVLSMASSDSIAHIFRTAIRPVLLYGVECVHHNKTIMHELDVWQAKLLKSALGIKRYSRSTHFTPSIKYTAYYQVC